MSKDKDIQSVRTTEIMSSIIDGDQVLESKKYSKIRNLECADLLDYILEKAVSEQINIVNELAKEGIKNPRRAELVGKTVKTIIALSEECGHPLKMMDGVPRYYDGKCWKAIGENDLAQVITLAARALGVQEYEAMYCDFIRKGIDTYKLEAQARIPRAVEGVQLLNCNNCTLEIHRDGSVTKHKHRPEDGLTYVLPHNYDPEATAPMFMKFLSEVLPLEPDRLNVQEYCGSLFSDINHEKLLYLYGATGFNGKTVLKDIVRSAIGDENTTSQSLESLTLPESNGTGEVARRELLGKVLNECGDIQYKIDSSAIFKKIVSREELSVRPPYSRDAIRLPRNGYARLLFCCNDLPVFTQGAANAEARRFLFIEFSYTIPIEKRDTELAKKIIAAEMSGVLNWIIEGLRRLSANKGTFTPNMHSEWLKAKFLNGTNSVFSYVSENGLVPDTTSNREKYSGKWTSAVISTKDIYKLESFGSYGASLPGLEDCTSYISFCEQSNNRPMGRNQFLANMQKIGFKKMHTKSGDVMAVLQLDDEARAEQESDQQALQQGEIFSK